MFVDKEKGLDNTPCGHSSSPCKTLRMAVHNAPNHGRILIHGIQYIRKTIRLDKSLTFQGLGDASIVSLKNDAPIIAFKIPGSHLNVTFVSIRFRGIGLLETGLFFKHSIIVVIHSCSFEGMHVDGRVVNTRSSRYKRRSGSTTLVIHNSLFTDSTNAFRVNIRTPSLTMLFGQV